MGVDVALAPHLARLMSAEDAARYGVATGTTTHNANMASNNTNNTARNSSRRSDADERREQGDFANWLLLQNSNGRKIPYVWHAMHTRSRASVGTPDFFVGINGRSLWFEFKRDHGRRLTPEQDEFRQCCEAQRIEWHVVYSAHETIQIVEQAAGPVNRLSRTGNDLISHDLAYNDGYCLLGLAVGEAAAAGAGVTL